MNKKITALTLVLAMLVAFVALVSCGVSEKSPLDKDDAVAAYNYVNEQMNKLNGFDVAMTMESSYGGEVESTEMEMKVDLSNKEAVALWVKMEIMGMELTYVDGTAYTLVEMSGMTIKAKSQDESVVSELESIYDIFSSEDTKIPASAEFVSRENGVYVIQAVLSAEDAMKQVYEDFGVESPDELAGTISDASFVVTYTCKANGLVDEMVTEMSYKLDGEAYSLKTTMSFRNVGTVPTITAPADADEYMDGDDLFGGEEEE